MKLSYINHRSDLKTFHPDALPWPKEISKEEREFYADFCQMPKSRHLDASLYFAKELLLLSDIERHVAVVLGVIANSANNVEVEGFDVEFLKAILNFAAEEYNHANLFSRYAAISFGCEIYPTNLFEQRLSLYLGTESKKIKLMAILASAYSGEMVMNAFEQRFRVLDPENKYFLSKMVYYHGLDEARHVKLDEKVLGEWIPQLTDNEYRQFHDLVFATINFNHKISKFYEDAIMAKFGVDYTCDNYACQFQRSFAQVMLDNVINETGVFNIRNFDNTTRNLLQEFCKTDCIYL